MAVDSITQLFYETIANNDSNVTILSQWLHSEVNLIVIKPWQLFRIHLVKDITARFQKDPLGLSCE